MLGGYARLYAGRAQFALDRSREAADAARAVIATSPGGALGEAALWLLADAAEDTQDWSDARNALRPQMDPEFERQGFKVVGWGDMGTGRFMSAGYDVKSPNDLKHKAAFYEPTDPIDPMTYSVLGDITPRFWGILVSGQEGYASADFIVGIVMGALSK